MNRQHLRSVGGPGSITLVLGLTLVACGVEPADEGVPAVEAVVTSEEPLQSAGSPLVLAESPETEIGVYEGAPEYVLTGAETARRLGDGGIVVAVGGAFELRRFDADGQWVWSVGRVGDGPGEFRGMELLGECSSGSIAVYDPFKARISVFNPSGELVRTFSMIYRQTDPPYTISCAPEGRFVFLGWG